ncbi:hypothetical protein ACFSCX_24650 [Bacillus salitolerans]|uniref:Uncharacterized protein n=1 Tax=Bacillus salitolerans TaxID=1437434 RepID=A0ABW4LZL0_9BACI
MFEESSRLVADKTIQLEDYLLNIADTPKVAKNYQTLMIRYLLKVDDKLKRLAYNSTKVADNSEI